MNELDFSFEDTPWEAYFQTLGPEDSVSAAKLLVLLEEEAEQQVEDAFQDLESASMTLDISGLTGSYYIQLYLKAWGDVYGTLSVTKVWME